MIHGVGANVTRCLIQEGALDVQSTHDLRDQRILFAQSHEVF